MNPNTIADGLLTSMGERTWEIIRDHVERVVTVSEEQIISAMRLVFRANEDRGRTERCGIARCGRSVKRFAPCRNAQKSASFSPAATWILNDCRGRNDLHGLPPCHTRSATQLP
jgi:threonine dehydratase